MHINVTINDMLIKKTKKIIMLILHYLNIILHFHSKAPTEEIKRNWEIIAIGGIPVVILVLFSGFKLWFIELPKIEFINTYGGWIFFIFIIIFVIVFFDFNECKKITDNQHKKDGKT